MDCGKCIRDVRLEKEEHTVTISRISVCSS
ncbi:hypothetical protein BsWGS_27579 [Bradybaena similaris]